MGTAWSQDPLDETGARALVVQGQRQDEGQDADGEPRRDGDVDRLERVGQRREAEDLARDPGDPDQQCEQDRVDRLGEEQVGDALDVADDAPALADDVGQRRELVVEGTICATDRAAELLEPIATPISASLRASTSLTPSPVIATVLWRDCSALTIARFWSGGSGRTRCRR